MDTLEYLKQKYNFSYDGEMPITIPRFGRRTALIQLFKELDFKIGVEIGTDHGDYAVDLCQGIPNLKLFCIDPYIAYTEGLEVKSQDDVEQIYQIAKTNIAPYNCEIIRKTSMETVEDFEDNSLDFVFIDGNHEYEYVLEDITKWTKKVKSGGIICGHDYTFNEERKYGVIRAVNKYVKDNNISPWFILSVPQHIPPRRKGNFIDCWMIIKQ